ncbi:MAG TPA: hypothetical protein VNU49_05475 [Opitutaceae bacterium]|nr:hypothetical protein [Opitutaceae bacterium]
MAENSFVGLGVRSIDFIDFLFCRFSCGTKSSIAILEQFDPAVLFDEFALDHFGLVADLKSTDKIAFFLLVRLRINDNQGRDRDPNGITTEVHFV